MLWELDITRLKNRVFRGWHAGKDSGENESQHHSEGCTTQIALGSIHVRLANADWLGASRFNQPDMQSYR